ncbi:MAG: RICIN domain-containing protein [Draconibacterium sp.]
MHIQDTNTASHFSYNDWFYRLTKLALDPVKKTFFRREWMFGSGQSAGNRQILRSLVVFIMLVFCSQWVRCEGVPVYTIKSGSATLTIRSYDANKFGIGIEMETAFYEQLQPCAVEVVTAGDEPVWLESAYFEVKDMGDNSYKCTGVQTSLNGSVFTFTDTYSGDNNGSFEVNRKVEVTSVGNGDIGFSTRLTFAQPATSEMSDYDFFVPGIWYRNNKNVSDKALATDYSDYYYWFREDRMPLPLFMLRDKASGATFSVCHKNPDGATFAGEDGLNRIIDGRMKFAAIGMQDNHQPAIGILYPGSEGERTGVYGMSASNKRWALRSHPVTQGYTQDYALVMRLTHENDYTAAMKNTWTVYYELFDPSLYTCDLNQIYQDQIALLETYWKSINNSSGFPFRVHLNGLAEDADYNWNMGFVGQQLPNAAILLREGINTGNQQMIAKAENTIDWWADNAIASTGCPRTWYDPKPQTWRNYSTFARVVGDGMEGMLWAWNFEKKSGLDKVSWLNACYRVANWLVTKQNSDGSFSRAWDYATNEVVFPEKTNTSHVIPFLVDMYKATGNLDFKNAALEAGEFIYVTNYEAFDYVGGTPDNPNVPDKEAASMALRAFLALYDANGDSKWLDAATQAAYYYETWIYAWNVPIPDEDSLATFPKSRETTGLSLIATGNNGADSYAAIDAYNFFRMYLYTNDGHLLDIAKLLLQNTKQGVNWDRNNPLSGFGMFGILEEALNVMIPRGHGVGYYLPWQTYNMVEPLALFWDVFKTGTFDISVINNSTDKTALHNTYSTNRNFEAAKSEAVESGKTYVVVNRNSGKVLEVAEQSIDDGANIQQGEYESAESQQWKTIDAGEGYFKLVSLMSGKVAGGEDLSANDGANVAQFSDKNTDNQSWLIETVGGGYRKIVNKNSGKVLEVVDMSYDDGANVSQSGDMEIANQQWLFVEVEAVSTTTGSIEERKNTIRIFPNPAESVLNVDEHCNSDIKVLGIYNSNGSFVVKPLITQNQQINISKLYSGMYFLKVLVDGFPEIIKFVKR